MLSNSSSSFSFGRRIPSARRRFFVWPAHSISAPPFLCLAGAFHQRAAVSLFGRRISSPRRILFRLPAHSPPIHRFGVAVRPAHLIAAPHSLPFRRRIRRRPTDLVLLFGRRISSPRRILFRLPAHSPPIH
jgi:hypothetical protein